MDGLVDSPLNGYYPADNAIVAYNTVVNSYGPAIKLGVVNKDVKTPKIAPINVIVVGNTIINSIGINDSPFELSDLNATFTIKENFFTNGKTNEPGFSLIDLKQIPFNNNFYEVKSNCDPSVLNEINQRLLIHNIKLNNSEITIFNLNWILKKKDVGVSWIKNI
jgi:hypothetical protein